jgi:hypothetical protein
MARTYPPNRKGVSGKPFPMLAEHNLKCYYCGKDNSLENVLESHLGSYPCEHCTRRSRVYKSKLGFYSMSPADRARYERNVKKGVNRI